MSRSAATVAASTPSATRRSSSSMMWHRFAERDIGGDQRLAAHGVLAQPAFGFAEPVEQVGVTGAAAPAAGDGGGSPAIWRPASLDGGGGAAAPADGRLAGRGHRGQGAAHVVQSDPGGHRRRGSTATSTGPDLAELTARDPSAQTQAPGRGDDATTSSVQRAQR